MTHQFGPPLLRSPAPHIAVNAVPCSAVNAAPCRLVRACLHHATMHGAMLIRVLSALLSALLCPKLGLQGLRPCQRRDRLAGRQQRRQPRSRRAAPPARRPLWRRLPIPRGSRRIPDLGLILILILILILTVGGVCVVCVVGGFVGGYWGVGDGGGWWRWYSGLGLGFDHRFRISQSVMSLLRTRRRFTESVAMLITRAPPTADKNRPVHRIPCTQLMFTWLMGDVGQTSILPAVGNNRRATVALGAC